MNRNTEVENGKHTLLDKKVYIKNETQIKCMILMFAYSYLLMYVCDLEMYMLSLWLTNLFFVGIHLIWIIPVFLVQRKWGVYQREEVHFCDVRQYLFGILLLIPYFAVYFLVYKTSNFDYIVFGLNVWNVLWAFFYYVVIVAITEEYVFRIFFQGELSVLLGRLRMLAPLISAILFAVIHIPQGNDDIVWMAFGCGLVLGYAKQYIKQCTFVSLVVAHGLYDFLVMIFAL